MQRLKCKKNWVDWIDKQCSIVIDRSIIKDLLNKSIVNVSIQFILFNWIELKPEGKSTLVEYCTLMEIQGK